MAAVTTTVARDAACSLKDADMLWRIRDGDMGALGEFYDDHGARAYGLAHAILHDQSAAEDCVQDAFVMLWKQAPKLDPGRGQLGALFLTIVHRRAIDAVRRRRGFVGGALTLDFVEVASSTRGVPELVDGALDAEIIRRAIARLPGDQRRTIQLSYFEGVTHAEIARIKGVPGGTVKSRLRLALQKLRAGLAAEFDY